jgi:hypothetical protein
VKTFALGLLARLIESDREVTETEAGLCQKAQAIFAA